MTTTRIFASETFMQTAEGDPIRSVVTESPHATVVAWLVLPGQRIAAHVHPEGQDTWTILSGEGEYQIEATGAWRSIAKGDVVVAHKGQVHGVINRGQEPLRFISVVCPAEAGYRLI